MLPELPVPSTFGRYELRSVLGRGGMGVVYEAVLVGLVGFRKRVALKVLAADDRDDPASRAALQREARVGAMLSHPNVVTILDLGREAEQWFIAMELVDGRPVSGLLRGGHLGPAEVLEVGLATCSGLAHIHDLRLEGAPGGLIHRDIKPQNLLVDRNGTLKIVDFGISALAVGGGERGGGSPAWMAPEQQAGDSSPRSDLFSLGAVLYALAARKTPFGSGSLAMREALRVEDHLRTPAFLEPVDAAVPGLGAVVRRCLRRDPAERYPTAQALASDLRALRPAVGWGDLAASVARAGTLADGPVARTPRTGSSGSAHKPTTRQRLVGRAAEVELVRSQLLAGERLLTLTGPGGVGKTRVAREVSARPDLRAVFVEAGAPADGVIGLARTIARALDVDLVRGDPVEQLVAAVSTRPELLLVLDGLEAWEAAATELVDALLSRAPDLRVLATSRIPLRAAVEQVVPLGPLSPADGATLFEHRAGIALREADRAALPALIEGLDGLPLAIELAAARAKTLGVPQILERLRDRFKLLVDPSRPGASLASTLGASFSLLRPWELRAMGELAVFAGGFALEAAEAVVKLDEWPDAPWALDVVSALLDASLLHHRREDGRFTMGHSVRQYALQQLAPEVRAAAEVRHGEYFAQLGAEDLDQSTLRARPAHLQRLEAELENLRAACERATDRGDVRVAEPTAFAAGTIYADSGPHQVGADLLDRVLRLPGLARRARLLSQRFGLLRALGRPAEARAALEEALRESVAAGDRAHAASVRVLQQAAEPDARRAVEELRRIVAEVQALGDAAVEGRGWSVLGNRLSELGELVDARAALERAVTTCARAGDGRAVALATMRLGRVDHFEGHHGAAQRRFEEAERGFTVGGDLGNADTARENHAVVSTELGALDDAAKRFEQVLAGARARGDRGIEANVGANLGEVALRRGRTDEARSRLEQALVLARVGGWRVIEARTTGTLGMLEAHLGRRDEAERAWTDAAARMRAVGLNAAAQELDLAREVARVGWGGVVPDALWEGLSRVGDHGAIWLWHDLAHALLERGDPAADRAITAMRAIRDRRPPLAPLSAAVAVLDARREARWGDPAAAARGLAGAERSLREEAQRSWLWLARTETLVGLGDLARARRAEAALADSVERAGFGPDTLLRAALRRLRATIGDGTPVDEPRGRG